MSWVRERDWRSEERRLMPEFVEQFFRRACRAARRAPGGARRRAAADRARPARGAPPTGCARCKRLGKPQPSYRKLTFRKEQRQRAEHEDAVLLSPGHPLYAATVEALLVKLAAIEQAAAPFVAPWATEPYPIHFFTQRVQGLGAHGQPEDVYAELVAVTEEDGGHALVGADVLHDLTPVDFEPTGLAPPGPEEIRAATNFVRVQVQQGVVRDKRAERHGQAELRSRYLREAMDAQLEVLQTKWSELDERVYRGDDAARLARDEADRRIQETRQRRERKLGELEQLGIVRPGPVLYLGTALVGPWPTADEPAVQAMRNDPEVEAAAMAWAMQAERDAGWDPEDVSNERDGRGFDIRSVKRGPRRRGPRRTAHRGQGPRTRPRRREPVPHRVDRRPPPRPHLLALRALRRQPATRRAASRSRTPPACSATASKRSPRSRPTSCPAKRSTRSSA